MGVDTDILKELRLAVALYRPKASDPLNARTPFPMIALPTVLQRFVAEAADALDVPPECVATPAIATCASAIGNSVRICLKKSWTEPSVIWAITLMESGSLKTPAYNAAFEPLRALQQLWVEQHEKDQEDFRQKKAQFEADTARWRASEN